MRGIGRDLTLAINLNMAGAVVDSVSQIEFKAATKRCLMR